MRRSRCCTWSVCMLILINQYPGRSTRVAPRGRGIRDRGFSVAVSADNNPTCGHLTSTQMASLQSQSSSSAREEPTIFDRAESPSSLRTSKKQPDQSPSADPQSSLMTSQVDRRADERPIIVARSSMSAPSSPAQPGDDSPSEGSFDENMLKDEAPPVRSNIGRTSVSMTYVDILEERRQRAGLHHPHSNSLI
jgi:hypothetical protein